MTGLAAFLAARLDEDEHGAQQALAEEGMSANWHEQVSGCLNIGMPGLVGLWPQGDSRVTRFVAEHDPARVLREVAAKRAIVELHKVYSEPEVLNIDHIDKKWNTGWVEHKETGHLVYWCDECDHDRDYGHIATPEEGCQTLRHLAAVYSDHPDYRDEWKP